MCSWLCSGLLSLTHHRRVSDTINIQTYCVGIPHTLELNLDLKKNKAKTMKFKLKVQKGWMDMCIDVFSKEVAAHVDKTVFADAIFKSHSPTSPSNWTWRTWRSIPDKIISNLKGRKKSFSTVREKSTEICYMHMKAALMAQYCV